MSDAALITQASALIEKYLDTYFVTTTTVERIDGGREFLIVTKAPIISITSIVDKDDSDAVVAATLYNFYPNEGLIYAENSLDAAFNVNPGGIWGVGRRRFEVTYEAGYTSAPADIELAILMLVTELRSRKDPSIKEESLGDYTHIHMDEVFGWNPKIKMILDNYKVRQL